LCASAFPSKRAHFRYLTNRSVTRIVSLTAERDLEEKYVKGRYIVYMYNYVCTCFIIEASDLWLQYHYRYIMHQLFSIPY
jgi:hypothetical protein